MLQKSHLLMHRILVFGVAEDFFRDLQEEFKNWEASAASQGKPKSLWEELADIGEEFVEFLEKELNITDAEVETEKDNDCAFKSCESEERASGSQTGAAKASNIEEDIDEIEATLAQLKKELAYERKCSSSLLLVER
ncbi:unnamed protein product [Thlaspi arvense]|uniref:Uncharacterized protein n=1 Tax=Thlaspi arvense TaxID=13288 RepID=A0AAU9S766_THLAR|nr:unnamed protein product [Thlaspi arvense]